MPSARFCRKPARIPGLANPLFRDAEGIWRAGVAAAGGGAAVAAALAAREGAAPDLILAVGKAAAAMAKPAVARYPGTPGLIVTKYGHADAGMPAHVRQIESGHPVPDAQGIAAGEALLDAVATAGRHSRLLLLVSGGASALAEAPAHGVGLKELQRRNAGLVASGLDIRAINAERRRFSRIKGGGLLAAFPGKAAEVLAISDVAGDDIAVIGSGIGERPAGRPDLAYVSAIVASNRTARDAAAAEARRLGYAVRFNDEALHCDIAAAADRVAAALWQTPPCAMIFGGEPTVRLPEHPGEGGRNQALALEIARRIAGMAGIGVLVAGTDGTDGPTEAAGGFADGETWQAGAAEALARADSGAYLRDRGRRFACGPTGTNVMDLVVALRAG
jgi:hydroxypyruvate reductase